MNERLANNKIYLLAKEAGLIEFEQLDWNPELVSPTYESVAKSRKFAELIVAECMSMCDVAQVGYLTHGHTLQGEGCQGAKQYIADWFEVEE